MVNIYIYKESGFISSLSIICFDRGRIVKIFVQFLAHTKGGSAFQGSLFTAHIVTFVPVFPISSQRRDLSFNPRRVLVARFSLGFNGERFEYSKHGQFLVVGAGPFTRISSLASEVYIYIEKRWAAER